jgi:flavodoxin
MMTALVVFESMFGNTKLIADAVAEGLARHLPVDQVEVSTAPTVIGGEVQLLGRVSRIGGLVWVERG